MPGRCRAERQSFRPLRRDWGGIGTKRAAIVFRSETPGLDRPMAERPFVSHEAEAESRTERPALLEAQDARRDDPRRVGIALRRLREMLPRQTRGRGHAGNLVHRGRLQAPRLRDLPLHGLQEPGAARSRLRAADAGGRSGGQLDAALLRLPAGGRGQGPAVLASAGLGRDRKRPPRRHVGQGQGRQRGRDRLRRHLRSHRRLAESGGRLKIGGGEFFLPHPNKGRHPGLAPGSI